MSCRRVADERLLIGTALARNLTIPTYPSVNVIW